jgi:NitT/TauT family transport system permease protein/sulfonate transport system permease protein
MTGARYSALEKRRLRIANLATLAALALWGIAGLFLPSYLLPAPWTVARELWHFVLNPHMWWHTALTLEHVFLSVVLSMIIGGALALLAHYVPVFRLAVHARLSPFLNSFAGTGWVLLAVLWFGLSDVTVVFAISMVLIPFAIINVRHGLESLDPDLVEMGLSFSRGRFGRFTRIVMPALVPFLFSTLRICFGVAWKAALTAELFGGNAGYGYLFDQARQDYDTPLVLTVILLIVVFVYVTERYFFEPANARLQAYYVAA